MKNYYSPEFRNTRELMLEDCGDFVEHGRALMMETISYCRTLGFDDDDTFTVAITQFNAMKTSILELIYQECKPSQELQGL